MGTLIRHLGVLAAAALACFYVIALLRGPQGIPAMMQMRSQVLRMEDENRRLKEEVQRKRKRIERLESDPTELERAVREQLNKQKPGETTIFLPESEQ